MKRVFSVPDRGDVVWLTFDPQAGHEQSGRRPALVLSPKNYNEKSSLALVCPITNQSKQYPFEIAIAGKAPVTGYVLADHVKSVDWRTRSSEWIGVMPEPVVRAVLDSVTLLLRYQ